MRLRNFFFYVYSHQRLECLFCHWSEYLVAFTKLSHSSYSCILSSGSNGKRYHAQVIKIDFISLRMKSFYYFWAGH